MIPVKITIDVVPINPILASNKIVRDMAATVMGIRYGEIFSFITNTYDKPISAKNINVISSTIFQSSNMGVLYMNKNVKKNEITTAMIIILPR
jgi:hypothetical protein